MLQVIFLEALCSLVQVCCGRYFTDWWTVTAVAGVVAAVRGMQPDTGNSPACTGEAALLERPPEAAQSHSAESDDEEAEIEGKSFIDKLRWLRKEKFDATESENYVRAARMKVGGRRCACCLLVTSFQVDWVIEL